MVILLGSMVKDMSNAMIEHSIVMMNFVTEVASQISDSLCKVFTDAVKYRWAENDNIPVEPDVSINCDIRARKGNTFLNSPRFIMEILSPSTESGDRGFKMDLYRRAEVNEYWIADWQKRKVECYTLDYNGEGEPQYYLNCVITEQNKEELRLVMFPHIKVSFDNLFRID